MRQSMGQTDRRRIRVVLFSGGRGSRALAVELLRHPGVELTLAVNGYDDGKSTGEVRRFLGDALGPSDFRKNASTVAHTLGTCDPRLLEILDARFPEAISAEEATTALRRLEKAEPGPPPAALEGLPAPDDEALEPLRAPLRHFLGELERTGKPFHFGDCALGNLVFAGCFLAEDRDFNAAIDAYGAILGVPPGLIENVTDGRNAFLVARDRRGELLASEEDLVDARRQNFVEEIWLVDGRIERLDEVAAHEVTPQPNPRLLSKIAAADLILYAPGTQHSSLFPSYLTEGIAACIADNWAAPKVLVANIERDVEIPDVSALELSQRALHYLRGKGALDLPAPALITHALLNDPTRAAEAKPYVPLGRLHSVEDPRLVRIGDYENPSTGGHDARKVLLPFIEAIAGRESWPRIAVFLYGTSSRDKLAQTVLEAARAGLDELGPTTDFWLRCDRDLSSLRFGGVPVAVLDASEAEARDGVPIAERLRRDYDYVVLFDSSGMYRGEDIVNVAALLSQATLDAVWGSRRLSPSDVRVSYQLRYRKAPLLGAASWLGSHLLSLSYLLLHGRYVSDVLSGVRAFRASHLPDAFETVDPARLNQRLLSAVLGAGGELFETPVRFFSMSPDHARRTTLGEGVRSLAAIVGDRLRSAG